MISQLMQQRVSFPEPAAQNIRNMTNESLVFSKRSCVTRKSCVYAVEPIVFMTPFPRNTKISCKFLNKRTLEDCGDGPMAKYRKVSDEFVYVTSTKRGFQTFHHCVATYEQTKEGLSYFYPKRLVDVDGIHARPFNL